MRLLFGMILGSAILVGVTYLYDNRHGPNDASVTRAERPVVNWDVVATKWEALTTDLASRAHSEWARIAKSP